MPAYNSAAHIESAIASLQAQDFADFELIISDNASTDNTVELVTSIAERDPRIRLVRQPQNIGANANYSAVARMARGEYFKWVSSSDWCPPAFLRTCVTALDARPDAALVYPSTRLFIDDVSAAEDYPDEINVVSDDPVARFWQVVSSMRLNNAVNGLIRTRALRQTQLIEHFPGSDIVLIGHLALLGKLVQLPDRLLYRRMDEKTATRLMSSREVERHHYPVRTARSLLPIWRLHAAWLRAVLSAPLGGRDRWRALAAAFRMFRWDRRALLNDLVIAMRFPFASSDTGHSQ